MRHQLCLCMFTGESRDFFYLILILLEKNARPVCETRRPKKKNNASEIRVWVHLYPWAENGGHVAARASRVSVHLFVSTWRPPMTAVVSATTMQPSALRLLSESWSALSATAKRPIEPSSGGLFKWLKEGNELNFTPKKKKKITGEYGSHSAANKGGRPKKKGEARGQARLPPPRQAGKADRPLVCFGVCNKSREQSGGEKPRATTVLKMTHDEIRASESAV